MFTLGHRYAVEMPDGICYGGRLFAHDEENETITIRDEHDGQYYKFNLWLFGESDIYEYGTPDMTGIAA